MPKVMKIATGSGEGASSKETTPTLTDWDKCIICQVDSDEPARCPAKSKRNDCSGYETFTSNMSEFEKLGKIPFDLDPKRLDEGEGVQRALEKHKAWWHKTCYNRFDSYHLVRARKRESSGQAQCFSPVKTRKSIGITKVHHTNVFFFLRRNRRKKWSS